MGSIPGPSLTGGCIIISTFPSFVRICANELRSAFLVDAAASVVLVGAAFLVGAAARFFLVGAVFLVGAAARAFLVFLVDSAACAFLVDVLPL